MPYARSARRRDDPDDLQAALDALGPSEDDDKAQASYRRSLTRRQESAKAKVARRSATADLMDPADLARHVPRW